MVKKKNSNTSTTQLNVKVFGLSSGITFGVGFLILGWAAGGGFGAEMVNLVGSVYVGYKPGFLGGIVGGAYAFVDAGLGGALIAWLYNKLSR
jgi:hypothetical protein